VKRLAVALAALAAAGCGPVTHRWLRGDYAVEDSTRTVRLTVLVSPLPAGDQELGDLWAGIARAWVNLHRDFIVNQDLAAPVRPAEACAGDQHGVLLLSPLRAEVRGEAVDAAVIAQLVRCRDGAVVWLAEGEGAWDSADEALAGQRAHWEAELGPGVAAHVAPAYRLLTGTLGALPEPAFADEGLAREKIELGE
jgi:probable lipoprotein (TIGR04455 family)